MALQRTQLSDILYPTTGTGIIYINNSAETTYFKGFLAHNTGTSDTAFSMFFLRNSGDANSINRRIFQYNIAGGETSLIDFPYSFVLTGTNAIRAYSSIQSGINVIFFGDRDV